MGLIDWLWLVLLRVRKLMGLMRIGWVWMLVFLVFLNLWIVLGLLIRVKVWLF